MPVWFEQLKNWRSFVVLSLDDDNDDDNDDELFCTMVDRRKVFSLISSREHCQRSSPSWISDTASSEQGLDLRRGLVEWSCAVVITTTPRRHFNKMNVVSKIQKIMFRESYCMWPHNFYMTIICKQLFEKFHFEFLHVFNFFPVLEIKKLVLVGKILWLFYIILHIWLTLSFPLFRWAGENTDLPSDRNIPKVVGVNLAFTRTFLKNIQ